MPWKEFLDGEILDASEVNTYFMDQAVLVFATESARNAAITSPNAGMFSYITDDEAIYIYDGTLNAWTKQLALIEDDAVDRHLLALDAGLVEDFPQCSVHLSVRVVRS